jgi:predicted transcriptional regulator
MQSLHIRIPARVYIQLLEAKPDEQAITSYILQAILDRPEIRAAFTQEEIAQFLAPSQAVVKQERAKQLKDEGMAVADIAKQLHVPRQTVYSWLRKNGET